MNQARKDSNSGTPDFLYKIAIDGLPIEIECMRAGAIYMISFDQWDDCTLLARQIFRRANVSTRGVLVTTADASVSLTRLQDAIAAHDLRTFRFFEGSVTGLKTLIADLDASIRPYQRTIILMLPASVSQKMNQEQRRALLAKCQPWLANNGCAVLILSTGSTMVQNSSEMLENNDLLAGLVHVKRISETELEYRCAYWRSALGVSGARSFSLAQETDELFVRSRHETQEQHVAIGEHRRYIIERAALNDFGHAQEEGWIITEARDHVYELARQEVDATAVFALSNFRQLPEVARLIHSLRLERGPRLKLVVRELSSQLRLRDEQNLLDCGANLVIGGHLSYTRFRSLLDNIQTVRYTRELTTSIDTLFSDVTVSETQGVVATAVFLEQVRDKIRTTLQNTKGIKSPGIDTEPSPQENAFLGVLVMMQPIPGFSPRQALAQINLRRFEDLACSVGHDVFLFLHGCLPELVPAVLQQLFRLPFEEIFISHTVFEDQSSIQGALQHIEDSLARLGDENLNEQVQAEDQQTPDERQPVVAVRYSPKRIRLAGS